VLLTSDQEWTEAGASDSGPDRPAGADVDGWPVETFVLAFEPGDTIVLCTDGAEATLEDRGLIRGAGDESPRLLASRIVSLAHRRDDSHDATAVVIRVRDARDSAWLELSRPPRDVSFGHAMSYA
jgi:serine/threonine protein phosphatase PrpC